MCGPFAWTNQSGRNKQAAHKNLEAVQHAQGTTDFKWQGWSNDGKNQNPTKSLGLPTLTPPKIPGSKIDLKKIPSLIFEP